MDTLERILLVPAAASAGVYLLMVGGFLAAMALQHKAPPAARKPRVSILKPLSGVDDELADNLASFEHLAYLDYEILLGVSSRDDAAYPIATELVTRCPRARLIVTDGDEAINPKVAQLLSLERAATGEIIVVSDSNVRVKPTYLDPLVSELHRPGVAVTSSVIAGTGEQSLGAALENFQLGALVAPGIVASAFFTGRAITVGKSMAMWRNKLHGVGGFARVGNLLSEDHMLARAFAEAGHRVSISLAPVANRNVNCTLRRTVERHTRWAKLRRSIAPVGFLLEPVMSPIVMTTLACLLAPSRATCLAFLSAVFVQTACAALMTRVVRGSAPRWYFAPLELVRSYLLFFCWIMACVSRRVSWRGHHFELGRDSAIVPAEPTVWARMRTLVRA